MYHFRGETEEPERRENALTSYTSDYHRTLVHILENVAEIIRLDISFRLPELENKVSLGFELSNYFTDDDFVSYTQNICRIVTKSFSKTAYLPLRDVITDMTAALQIEYNSFVTRVEACGDDSSAKYGSKTDVILGVQALWENQQEQSVELRENLEIRMTQMSDVANGLLWSILETAAYGDRQNVRTTALQHLNDFVKAIELTVTMEVWNHFHSMISLVNETFKTINTAKET